MRSHLTLEGIKFKPCIDISLCSAPVLRIAIISGDLSILSASSIMMVHCPGSMLPKHLKILAATWVCHIHGPVSDSYKRDTETSFSAIIITNNAGIMCSRELVLKM